MAEPKQNITFRFDEKSDSVFKLFALGYNDFRTLETYNFIRKYDWFSLHFVRNGKGTLIIGNEEYSVCPGHYFLIPPNTPVTYYQDEKDPWRYYWFALSADTLLDCEKLLGINEENPVYMSNAPETIITLFDRLFESFPASSPTYFNVLSFIMKIIDEERPQPRCATPLYSPESIVEKTKDIIEFNFMRPDFSVGSIGNILYISQQHLCRLFKKSTGLTPVAYLADKRIRNAAKLLEYGDFSIHALSEKCGFENDAYFMRCFKKRYGMTVKEYRKFLISQKSAGEQQ